MRSKDTTDLLAPAVHISMNTMSPLSVAPVALLTSVARLPRPARVPSVAAVYGAVDRLTHSDRIADMIADTLAAARGAAVIGH
jgi:hypothetical protein